MEGREPMAKPTTVLAVLAAVIGLAACAAGGPAAQGPTAPAIVMVDGPAYLDSVDVLLGESAPPQLALHFMGSLPTPCHQLMWDADIPDGGGQVSVDVYSQSPADLDCIQVLAELDETIALGPIEPGHYTIVVNGEQVGELDV
jgi:hypothetical protein